MAITTTTTKQVLRRAAAIEAVRRAAAAARRQGQRHQGGHQALRRDGGVDAEKVGNDRHPKDRLQGLRRNARDVQIGANCELLMAGTAKVNMAAARQRRWMQHRVQLTFPRRASNVPSPVLRISDHMSGQRPAAVHTPTSARVSGFGGDTFHVSCVSCAKFCLEI